jgi:hypothetical protein
MNGRFWAHICHKNFFAALNIQGRTELLPPKSGVLSIRQSIELEV